MFASTILTTLALLATPSHTTNPNIYGDRGTLPNVFAQRQGINQYLSGSRLNIDKLDQDLSTKGEEFEKRLYVSLKKTGPKECFLENIVRDEKFPKEFVEKLNGIRNQNHISFITKILIEILDIKLRAIEKNSDKEEKKLYEKTLNSLISSGFELKKTIFNCKRSEENLLPYDINLTKILRVFLFDYDVLKEIIGLERFFIFVYDSYFVDYKLFNINEIGANNKYRKFFSKVFSEIINGDCVTLPGFPPSSEYVVEKDFLSNYSWFVKNCVDFEDGKVLKELNFEFTVRALLKTCSDSVSKRVCRVYVNTLLKFLYILSLENNDENIKKLYHVLFYTNNIFEKKEEVIILLQDFFIEKHKLPTSCFDFNKALKDEVCWEEKNRTPEFECAYQLFLYVLGVDEKSNIVEKNVDVIKLLDILRKVDYFDRMYENNCSLRPKNLNGFKGFKLFTSEENIKKIVDCCDNGTFLRSRLAKDIFYTKEFSDCFEQIFEEEPKKLKSFLYKYVYYQGTSPNHLKINSDKKTWKLKYFLYLPYNYFFGTADGEEIMSTNLERKFKGLTQNFVMRKEDLHELDETEKIIYVVNFIEKLEASKKDIRALEFIYSISYNYLQMFFECKTFKSLISENKKGRELFKENFEKLLDLEDEDENIKIHQKWEIYNIVKLKRFKTFIKEKLFTESHGGNTNFFDINRRGCKEILDFIFVDSDFMSQ